MNVTSLQGIRAETHYVGWGDLRYTGAMNGILARHRLWLKPGAEAVLRLSGLFWIFTYVLLSVRAAFIPEVPDFFTPQRVLSVTAGSFIFYAATRHLMRSAASSRVTNFIVTFVVSAAAALTIRLGLDGIVFEGSASVAYSVRWTIVWTGYFGVWLIGTLAYFHHVTAVQRVGRNPDIIALPTAADAMSRPAPRIATGDDEMAWEWLVDVLADELAVGGVQDPRGIASRLVRKAGYEVADPHNASAKHNARARLATSIASRL